MNYRIFKLNNEYCIIHYPNQPNGFGVLIIGDDDQYVGENNSNWLDNYNRLNILQSFIDEGYTIFYTNFGSKQMGNAKSVEQVHDLYEHIKRTEILNEKIHIIAEGIGALIAVDFLENKADFIRSIVFINPVFSLTWLLEILKNQPFLLKRVLKDISVAYEWDEENCVQFIKNNSPTMLYIRHPHIIIHILEHGVKDKDWIQLYKKYLYNKNDNIYVIMPEKRTRIAHYAKKLFKKTERQL